MPRVMTTNGGPHTANTWAVVSGEEIVNLASSDGLTGRPVDADGSVLGMPLDFKNDALVARRFQQDVIEAVAKYHKKAEDHELAQLADKADQHLYAEVDGPMDLDACIAEIQVLADQTPWAAAYHAPAMVEYMRDVMTHHTKPLRLQHRHYHAHRNPSDIGHHHLISHGQVPEYGKYLPTGAPTVSIQNS